MPGNKKPDEGHNVSLHDDLESMQRMGNSPGGQLAWVVAKVVVTAFMTLTVALVGSYVRDMRDDLRTASAKIEQQQTAQALMSQKMDGLSKVSDATVAALNAISQQVQHNTYDVQALKVERSDPPLARHR